MAPPEAAPSHRASARCAARLRSALRRRPEVNVSVRTSPELFEGTLVSLCVCVCEGCDAADAWALKGRWVGWVRDGWVGGEGQR